MEISNKTIKKLRGLIVFTLVILVGLWKFNIVLEVLQFLMGIIFPFILGGAIAFIINVPMSFLEKKLFRQGEKKKRFARPASLIVTIFLVIGVIALVMFVVVPQLGNTIVTLGNSIGAFFPKVQDWVGRFTNENQDIMQMIGQLEFNPQSAIKWVMSFLGNGAGNVMNSTFTVARTLVSAIATFFIAFSFACYILVQKEKLHVQVRKVLFAFIPKKKAEVIIEICSLTYKTFASFLAGQCLEAVILGSMFVLAMTVCRMPYALLIGILIAFTALIPVFGAFIGCGVGTFLIFMVSPKQAIFFIVLFLILQQIEGNFIYPHVVGGSVGLPSIWVLAAVSIGGNLLGIVGMIIFIPMASVLYALFREYVYLKLKKQRIKKVTAQTVEEYTPDEVEQMRITFLKEHTEPEE
ncbi:MAG: AI-2E family transporter [Hespellia sp.]|nr:AI-2E family transporter [Hespellia sp.]